MHVSAADWAGGFRQGRGPCKCAEREGLRFGIEMSVGRFEMERRAIAGVAVSAFECGTAGVG